MSEIDDLRRAMAQIARIAGAASKGVPAEDGGNGDGGLPEDVPGCTIKSLPKRLLLKAANRAMQINPVNAPLAAPIGGDSIIGVMDPLQIAVITGKYWGPTPRQLSVSFMESTPTGLRKRILGHMNAWTRTACISFVETNGTGDVRISREGSGYWSYLGTDILHIPSNRPTMNLQAFSMSTPESEYHRVVRHETGHTLGFPHEHMRKELVARIDPKKAYDYFERTQGWDQATVDAQVLTPLDQRTIMGTDPDQTSIMCYQLPASITKDGKPIVGGLDINANDYAFAGRIYPKRGANTVGAAVGAADEDWPEDEDVTMGE
jgi:hypothetical protein